METQINTTKKEDVGQHMTAAKKSTFGPEIRVIGAKPYKMSVCLSTYLKSISNRGVIYSQDNMSRIYRFAKENFNNLIEIHFSSKTGKLINGIEVIVGRR